MPAVLSMLAVLLSALIVCSDLYARRVPNQWLVATLLVAIALPLAGWLMGDQKPMWPSAPGLAVGLLSMLPFYAMRLMGAGDVKFFATLGFLLSAKALLPIWVLGSLFVGMHVLVIVLLKLPAFAYSSGLRLARVRLACSPLWQRVLLARQGRVGQPYAAYLGVAAMLTILHPEWQTWGFA